MTCFYLQPIHFTLTFVKIKSSMTQITIDKKKYVIIPEKEYQQLLKNAALKSKSDVGFTIEEARAYSKKVISKWATKK